MPSCRARLTLVRRASRTVGIPAVAVLALQVLQFLQGVLPQPQAVITMPAPPKRPLNAYMLFANEQRAGLVGKGRSVAEVGKLLGEQWRQLSKGNKDAWTEKAGKDKARYQEDLRTYELAYRGPPPSSKSKKSLKQVGEKAKRAPSAYNLFVKERMPGICASGVKLGDAAKSIAKEWAELPKEQQAEWKLPAAESGPPVAAAAAAPQGVATSGAAASRRPKKVTAPSTKEKQRKAEVATPLPEGTKAKKKTSSYMGYSQQRMPELLKELGKVTEASKVIGREWREMTDEQKAAYQTKAAAS